jgi:DNA ligase (NAD+)
VIANLDSENKAQYIMSYPAKCPVCNGKVEMENGTFLYCRNECCGAKSLGRIEHFVECMDIKGLGKETLKKIIEKFNIVSPYQLYHLSTTELTVLEGIEKKSADKICSNIQDSRNNPLWRVVWALGINSVGGETAKDIVDRFKSLTSFRIVNDEQYKKIKGIGGKTAHYINKFINSDYGLELIIKLIELDVGVYEEKEGGLNNVRFCITGSFDKPRSKIKKLIQEEGGEVKGLSGKTDYLLVGSNPGSKVQKAEDKGVDIIRLGNNAFTIENLLEGL